MNKITISDYALIMVKTKDGRFLLIDKEEQTRIAIDLNELISIIKKVFGEEDK